MFSRFYYQFSSVAACFKVKPCRNRQLLQSSFFSERFTPDYVALAQRCGVFLAVHYPALVQLGLHFQLVLQLDLSSFDFDPWKQDFSKCCFQGFSICIEGCFVHIPRNTEPLKVVMKLPCGTHQLVHGLPGEIPPFRRSLWLTSDGFFYVLGLKTAEVSHRLFTAPTYLLRAFQPRLANVVVSQDLKK